MVVALETKGKRFTVRPFVVIDGNGTLKIFDTESMKKMRYSMDLAKYTDDSLSVMFPDENSDLWRVRVKVHDTVFEFIFDDKKNWMEFQWAVDRYRCRYFANPPQNSKEFVSLPIYKRPKDDEKDDLKEPSLKPQQYLSSETHPLPNGAVPHLNLFENMRIVKDCHGESEENAVILCPVIMRLAAMLNYYNSLMMSAVGTDDASWRHTFIEFCDKHYGEYWMLEDYMHFITNHSDLESTIQIASALQFKCFGDLKRCGGTARHYRNRQREDEDEVHFYINAMDSLHFNVLHLVDVGLRVKCDDDLQPASQNNDSLVDPKVLKMYREIQTKRQQNAFHRIDGTGKNSKFSLCSTVESNDGAKGGMTKMDSVLKDFQKEVGDEVAVHRLIEFMVEQRYDTETMNEDMAVYAEARQCNVRLAMKAHDVGEGFWAIRRWLRYHRVSGSSFSTGKWWAYWPWYRRPEVTAEYLMKQKGNGWEDIDFGGHSIESLCVYPHFANLKEETLGSGLISVRFWKKLFKKAKRCLQSKRCREMSLKRDFLNFGVPLGFRVTVRHLMALLLYTDSSKYCTALSETFRAIKPDETIKEMNARNSIYYWTSRYLREMVFCFGKGAWKEKQLYFTGISLEIHLPQFKIGLIGPTSCSMVPEVAIRFAGENGMIIVLKSGLSRCFDASVFSAYPEEQEQIFFGSNHRETVSSIVLVNSANNYEVAVGAYSKFDAIFSGQKPVEMSDLEVEIITESLRWINGNDDAADHKKLDVFILETFYSFIIHKKMVFLNLDNLWGVKDKRIVNMVINPLWNEILDDVDKPVNANLLKPLIFTLFRDVHQIRILGRRYPFDLMLFLQMIRGVDIPETLDFIIIDGSEFIYDGFTDQVKEEYALAGITAKKEITRYWTLSLKFVRS